MSYQTSKSPIFLSTVESWIEKTGEVLLMIRFSHCGGQKSFEFFTSIADFQNRLTQLQSRTCLIVFQQRQLPHRGLVDNDFITVAHSLVRDGEEYLIVGQELVQYGKASWLPISSGESLAELKSHLEDYRGRRVAFGRYPPWLEDNENVISAVIPQPDGTVECGIY